MRQSILAAALLCCAQAGSARSAPASDPPRALAPAQNDMSADRMAWWREARFGLFLHWGLYAVPAGEWKGGTDYGEWIRHSGEIPIDEYDRFRERFDPFAFDADAWARMAADAGMRYVVITTKHHDGFSLFDSALTDFDIMSTPFGRDIMRELADACRRHGLKLCWYHSIMDWHHPDYLPRRGWEDRPVGGADYGRYVDYLRGQVTELLTNYGDIGVMWFDGEWEGTWTSEHGHALYELCRELQPDVIVNNRVDKGRGGMAGMTSDARYAGDFGTPEQEIPATGIPGVDWETCMTMNRHWGYNSRDEVWKSSEDLVRKLVDIASKGGNFLLNVGPTADGTFPEESVERLAAIGGWMRVHGEAIHGTQASPFDELAWGRCTMRPGKGRTTLYLSVFDWPADARLVVPGLGNRVLSARMLEYPEAALAVAREGGDLTIRLPAEPTDPYASVVALEVQGEPIVYETPRVVADADEFVRMIRVGLEARSDALELRYTTDGGDPTRESTLYEGPFWLQEAATVKARAFHEGRPVCGVAERGFRVAEPVPGAVLEDLEDGLACELYRGAWDELPDFDALEPVARTVVDRVHPWHPGEGPPPERYGLRMTGWLEVPGAQVYTFALESDDGARLTIAGRVVVDHDGLHGPTEARGQIALGGGLHPITVEWFNKTGGAALALRWKPVGADSEEILPGFLTHE